VHRESTILLGNSDFGGFNTISFIQQQPRDGTMFLCFLTSSNIFVQNLANYYLKTVVEDIFTRNNVTRLALKPWINRGILYSLSL